MKYLPTVTFVVIVLLSMSAARKLGEMDGYRSGVRDTTNVCESLVRGWGAGFTTGRAP